MLITRQTLGHDTVGAVDKLLDTPKLFVGAGERRQRDQFLVSSSRQRAVCSGNDNLIVRTTQITTALSNRLDGP